MLALSESRRRSSTLGPALLAAFLATAANLLAHGDLHERIDTLSRSIQASPTNAELFLQRGELHRLHAEPQLAIADFERALTLNPALDLAQLGIGRAYLDAGRPAQARPVLDTFLSRHPQHAEGRLVRARVLAAMGECRAAAADYTGAIGGGNAPLPEVYLERAAVLAQAGLIDEAIAGLDEGLAHRRRSAPLALKAVDLEVGRNRYDAALARLEDQIERAPRKEFLLYRRGGILEKAGRFDEARAAYAAASRALQTLLPERLSTPALSQLGKEIQTALSRLAR